MPIVYSKIFVDQFGALYLNHFVSNGYLTTGYTY